MNRPRYGFTTYSCSCQGSLLLGLLLAFVVILLTAAATGQDGQSMLRDLPLIFIGMPLITIVLSVTSFFMIWTPERAYWFVSWMLQDFWQVGRDIWSEKHGKLPPHQ